MNKKLTPRYIIIALILAWAVYALWPSVSFQQMSEEKKETLREEGKLKAIESKIIKQGLDLKGGMYIVLEVDLPTLISGLAINRDKELENTLNNVNWKVLVIILFQYIILINMFSESENFLTMFPLLSLL